MEQSTIRAFQKVLLGHRFEQPINQAEDFAQRRYLKKMELPDTSRDEVRSARCWNDFITYDQDKLPPSFRPSGRWYVARQFLLGAVSGFSLGNVSITNGSEFNPTRGENSIEAKLASSDWSVTRDCRDLAIKMIRGHYALTRSFKQRYRRALGNAAKGSEKFLWEKSKLAVSNWSDPKRAHRQRIDWIWLAKSEVVFSFVEGSRFSTVRKNNEKDRPVNIETLLNMLVQRTIGNGLRKLIRELFNIDLDVQSDVHKVMIAFPGVATIDLKNASDSVLVELCEFLFPKWFFRLLMDARSPFILGPDGDYHVLRKISAMGNGFTFELMTLIILSLVRTYDHESSVFGDDIIVKNDVADAVVSDLESVGFVVNIDKSFIRSDFRESCGANFLDGHGYIKSFDFEYPLLISDCAVLYNKCALLALDYPSFEDLRRRLFRSIPQALRGGLLPQWSYTNAVPSASIPSYFACASGKDLSDGLVSWLKECYHLDSEKFTTFPAWEYVPKLRSKTHITVHPRRHWAKYLMYLSSGGRCDDVIRGIGSWRRVTFISDGCSTWRKSAIREAKQASLTPPDRVLS